MHEYGHTLGIDHSADSHDYMATTLTAGVRRLPSAEEMALMQQLVGQVKVEMTNTLSPSPSPASGRGELPGFPTLPLGANFIGFLGLLRSSCYGGVSIAPTQAPWSPSTPSPPTPSSPTATSTPADGWSTQGGVDIGMKNHVYIGADG